VDEHSDLFWFFNNDADGLLLLLAFDEAFEREKVLDGSNLFLFDSDV
jgi:hypothetical protein